ncbi:hypothetical protein [Nocardia sp. XZ_19_385]|uniref:hypothetical protein n=1 Tax=Nocardia sp. XZ_19_385 TaxID=2769488 RepID=UPI0018905E5E|nr:hypothetical protein [Nocardia sp. XZ_19_385]
MPTQQELNRWSKVLENITIPYDNTPSPIRMLVEANRDLPHAQAAGVIVQAMGGPLVEAWEAGTPAEGSVVRQWIEPAYLAAKALDVRSTEIAQFGRYIAVVKEAQEALLSYEGTEVTVAEVLTDLELDFKLAVLSARVGHQGIMGLIDQRLEESNRAAGSGAARGPKYLDLQSLRATETSSCRTLSYSEMSAMADPGVATAEQWIRGPDESDQSSILKYFAAQWVTYMVTQWEELYRDQLAQAHGCEKNDIRSELFADLNRVRQDYVHNRGKASRRNAAKNTRLKWFRRGDQMVPKHADYDQLFEELAREVELLAVAPTPTEKPNRSKVNAQVPVELIQRFEQAASDSGLTAGGALEAALLSWIESRD